LAFLSLHQELEESGYDSCSFHPIRDTYWKNIPEGMYTSGDGKKLVKGYFKCLESEISKIISKNSIAYWIHLLRRIACTLAPCGDDRERGSVVGLVRCILEASIQKYATIEPCHRVGLSSELELEDILDGFFIKWDIGEFTDWIIENPQLVLTKFGLNELKEFYQLEKLVFEIWRSAANLRGLNKGALWLVTHNPGDAFEERDSILEESIKIYDERYTFDYEMPFTSKGTGYELKGEDPWVHIPIYNVEKVNTKTLIEGYYEIFGDRKIVIENDIITNFLWIPINMRSYYKSNLYYSKEFEELNNVNFKSVLVVFTALLIRTMDLWNEQPNEMFKCWQRGYEGPYRKENIFDILKNYLLICLKVFELDEEVIDLKKGFLFWTLTDEKREMIDMTYPGPHSIFLPYGKDHLFIDYAWMNRRLFDLFWNCKIKDENFKGTALELLIQKQGELCLPTKPCKSFSGEKRQIDASFEKDDILLIIDCKAIGTSIAFDRGTEEAISYRKRRYNEAIDQIDEKAEWLIRKRKGTNFDITKYHKIIPIVVTPFIEYIRTDERKYWISDKIPRILTPSELTEMIKKDEIWNAEENTLFIE